MPTYQAEVIETMLRHRLYFVEAGDAAEAEEMLRAGDTVLEKPRGEGFKDEIIARSPGPAIEMPGESPAVTMDMSGVDWVLLRHQKLALLEVMRRDARFDAEGDGLLELIDSIQDQAVAAGVPEETVFGTRRTE